MAENPLDRLRAICLGLPEVTEKLNHGQPSWVVRGRRTVVQYLDGTDRFGVVGMWCPVREDLVEAEPVAQGAMAEFRKATFRNCAGRKVAFLYPLRPPADTGGAGGVGGASPRPVIGS